MELPKELKQIYVDERPLETITSKKTKVKWQCDKHTYIMSIEDRLKGKKCGYCSGKKVLKGFNDFASQRKQFLQFWNDELNPEEIHYHGHIKINFKCEKGHEWKSEVRGVLTCPYCTGRRTCKETSILATHPDVAKEYSVKNKKPIEQIGKGNNIDKLIWQCEMGHEWIDTASHRCLCGRTCPKCKVGSTSFGEQAICFYFGGENRYKYEGYEIDCYLANINIGIEFNGIFWHKDKKKYDKEKEKFLSQYIKIFYIKESKRNMKRGNKIYFDIKNYNKNLEWAIKELTKMLKKDTEIDLEKDRSKILSRYLNKKRKNSFGEKHFEMLNEWDYNKNVISPYSLSCGSNEKVWFLCSLGHSYSMSIKNKLNGCKCPYCSGKKILKGLNDLFTKVPVLKDFWSLDNELNPYETSQYSEKIARWECKNCGYKWDKIIFLMAKGKKCCPKCKKN